ncbi:MAG: NfeD family protein, partial [Chlamydiia bacterium]|nr:NfeD family protein [Chlamydiia bacterium]
QFAWCFGLTVAWTGLLWKPMRKFRLSRKRAQEVPSNNLIGQTAVVAAGGLKTGEMGQVVWSGTLMNAELEGSHLLSVPEGTHVQIHSVFGNTLKVRLK